MHTINSKEVSQLIGKRHDNLLRTIRTEVKKLTHPEEYYREATYRDGKGQVRECFEITMEGCKWLSNKLPIDKRKEFIEACMGEAKETETADKVYTVKEIAELFGVSERTVGRYIKSGDLVAKKQEYKQVLIKERLVITPEALRNFERLRGGN